MDCNLETHTCYSVLPPSAAPQLGASECEGSNRDEHGCLGCAGYVWCAAKGKCIRPWMEDCDSVQKLGASKRWDDCVFANDCPFDTFCNRENGECTPCDCPIGTFCDRETGQCELNH